jgi:hypothetical protein
LWRHLLLYTGIGTSKAALIVLRPHTGDEIRNISIALVNACPTRRKHSQNVEFSIGKSCLKEENTYTLNTKPKVRNT